MVPGGDTQAFMVKNEATLTSKKNDRLTLGTLGSPSQSFSVLHAELGKKQLLLIKQR